MFSTIQRLIFFLFNLRNFKFIIGSLIIISIVYNTYQYNHNIHSDAKPKTLRHSDAEHHIQINQLNDTSATTTTTTTPTEANTTSTVTTLINNSFTTTQTVTTLINQLSLNSIVVERKLLETCPLIPKGLGTRIAVDLVEQPFELIELFLKNLTLPISIGGFSSPQSCVARTKVAIVIPYRNRDHNLKLFLKHIHPFLNKQQLDYGIYLVEPVGDLSFNRGLLMNIGFLEALKQSDNRWECFIFHDVDLLPEDERNLYTCAENPRHMSSAVSTLSYRLPYDAIFGGVTAITQDQMKNANGYSNIYFGWGGEDDDFRHRFINKKYKIVRYPLDIGRYYMAKHKKDPHVNAERHTLLRHTDHNQDIDGLTSIEYEVTNTTLFNLYTHIFVTYDKNKLTSNKKLKHNEKKKT